MFPTLEQAQVASQFQLATWMRTLPSPGLRAAGSPDFEDVFNKENEVMNCIIARFKGWTPTLSKAVGW